jgi:hypothetical protein
MRSCGTQFESQTDRLYRGFPWPSFVLQVGCCDDRACLESAIAASFLFVIHNHPKAKVVPLHATKVLGWRGIAPTHSWWGWVVWVTPRERTPGTHCTEGWVDSGAGLDTEAIGKILSPLPWIEPRSPGRPARSHTLYWLSYPGSP